MPRFNFFTNLGLLPIKDFLDANQCAALRSEMESQSGYAATVGSSVDGIIDEDVRRAKWVKVSEQTRALIKERLIDLKPGLESHFKIKLDGFEKPQFLIYREGCFYTPHRDSSDEPEALEYFRGRKLSVVIFLNDESDEQGQDRYGGGQLTFYGLMDNPLWKHCGLPLKGERGLMVAFRSNVMHEVKAVTHGVRLAITTWFY